MSVVVYSKGVMAADSGGWIGSVRHENAHKVAQGSDGTLYGAVGNSSECWAYLEWVRRGCTGPMPTPEPLADRESSFMVMKVAPNTEIHLIGAYGEERFYAEYFAIGAGAAVALGALFVGANARDAVRAAIMHSDYAAGLVREFSLPQQNGTFK